MRLVGLAGVVAVAGALAGCGVGWPISRGEIGSAPPDAARLVVYRPSGEMLPWRSFGVDLNGVSACDLSRATGFARDVGAGKVTVSVHLWDVDRKSSLSWQADAAKIYYVRVQIAGENGAGPKGGLFGLGSAEVGAGDAGPFDLALTDEAAAVASGVKLAQCHG